MAWLSQNDIDFATPDDAAADLISRTATSERSPIAGGENLDAAGSRRARNYHRESRPRLTRLFFHPYMYRTLMLVVYDYPREVRANARRLSPKVKRPALRLAISSGE